MDGPMRQVHDDELLTRTKLQKDFSLALLTTVFFQSSPPYLAAGSLLHWRSTWIQTKELHLSITSGFELSWICLSQKVPATFYTYVGDSQSVPKEMKRKHATTHCLPLLVPACASYQCRLVLATG
eukprot:5999680-Amphidinium_carterae.1